MKIKLLLSIICLVVFTLTYTSCQKELAGFGDTIDTPANDLEQTNASVQGYVTLETGLPAVGAQVTSGTTSTLTDAKGYFRFSNIQLSKNNGFVKVALNGYFNGSRSFVTATGRVQNIRIQLIPKTNSGNVDATSGGVVTLSNGLAITFPAGAFIVSGSNAAYTGNVKVSAAWIDPTATDLLKKMPGDLRGITSSGAERGLETFGMMAAELTGSGGEVLAMASGKKASISFPLPASLASSAPSTIALWHFDETSGRWKEEGTAIKNGSTYTAEVSHFSFWNCDAPFPLVTFTATIVNSNNSPLVHALVRIKKISGGQSGYGYTDSTGFVTGKIPANEPLVLEVLNECHDAVFSQNIGPFSNSVNLGIISVSNTSASILTISGSVVTCASIAVTTGHVEIYLNNMYYRAPLVNGAFSLSVTNCNNNTTGSILAIDDGGSQQSTLQTFTISSSTVVIPAIVACGMSSQETVDYTLDAVPFSLSTPADSILSYQQTGNTPTNSGVLIHARSLTVPGKYIRFQFTGPAAVGPHQLYFYEVGGLDSAQVTTVSPTTNITTYGSIGQFIEGSFSIQLKKLSDNSLHTVTCTYRVRRR